MPTLDNEQQQALKALERGENVFLTGEAGTGKSTILEKFRSGAEDCVFLAPTGIAAVNIHGTTIHSFLEFSPGLLIPETIRNIRTERKEEIIRSTRTIVVDEISMVRSDLFTCMDARLRQLSEGKARSKPFGGRQIVVVGDFFQLPPVVNTDEKIEIEYLQKLGGCYAFQTKLWKEANFHCFCLTTVHRQQDDRRFAQILNQIRHGRLQEETLPAENGAGMTTAASALNVCALPGRRLPHPPVCLTTTNLDAQAINAREKARLKGEGALFRASVTGSFAESYYPTESVLELKPGVRVMLLCNKRKPNGELLYVNGDLGVVMRINEEESEPVTVKLDKGKEVTVGPNTWSKYEYYMEYDQTLRRRCVRQRVVGTFVQLPLKLAYAVTIHKAQGLTLDCVDLKLGNGCFAHGQLYTALSRCRSINGLRIDREISDDDLHLDSNVVNFYEQLNAGNKSNSRP